MEEDTFNVVHFLIEVLNIAMYIVKLLKTTKFMSNVLEAISKLKLKNSKNHFSNLVLYLTYTKSKT